MVFTHPHILFDPFEEVQGNQFQFSYEKESDEEFSRHLFNLHEKHKKLSHEYNSVIHSPPLDHSNKDLETSLE